MKKQIFLFATLLLIAGSSAFSAQYDLINITPEVMKVVHSRQDRFNEIQELKKFGDVGENSLGYLKSFSARADEVVRNENADRDFIYKEIIRQNNLPHSELIKVQQVFAEVHREKSAPGTLIQKLNGNWVKK